MPIITLRLEYNYLNAIPDLSDINGTLTNLHIGCNNITAVSASDFDSLGNVLTLGLDCNRLQTIPSDAFCSMPLQRVYLRYNEFYEVPDLTCVSSSLRKLMLEDNHISNLHDGDFVGFVALKYLSLNGNRLHNINGLRNLSPFTNNIKIFLQDNNLATLATSLQNFSQIAKLNLSGNSLAPWQSGAFRHSKIVSLYLASSNITCFYLVRRFSLCDPVSRNILKLWNNTKSANFLGIYYFYLYIRLGQDIFRDTTRVTIFVVLLCCF